MNVFRSRKKSIGEIDLPRPSLENAPPLPKHSRTIFGRKKQQPEQKREETDLNITLPSNDDFRTSLIMPNLASRFSMLREQDDPKTKIGKASDDSVLFPKRASRLDLFGLGNLDDIAEVSSITGSFRPPFAQDGRTNSYASDGYDGYASDTGSTSGSIMGRSRPGQGNQLFGGRQKVYKISPSGPAVKNGSSRPSSSGNSVRGLGKPVYEGDVSSSLWQRMRAEERAKRSFDHDFNDTNIDGRLSPSFSGYNRNRETSSSTTSYERVSTAATSMTSVNDGSNTNLPAMMSKEPARDRPLNKRMYGQGIDQQVHEQQNSAIQRLNSVRGGRGFGGLGLSKTGQRPGAASGASSLRSGSPSPALNLPTGFDFVPEKQPQLNTRDADSGYQGSSAMPSPISPHAVADPTLTAHIDPNDLGKATASGTFNKPKARYDDQQFAQRQLQLREGRETPQDSRSRSETPSDRASSRLRKDSDTSVGRGTPTQNFSRIRANRSVSRESDLRHASGQSRHGSSAPEASDSEDSFGHSSPRARGTSISTAQQLALEEQHPALRAPITEEEEPNSNLVGSLRVPGSFESPVLTPAAGGLNEMVRGHLRNQSDASSVYSDTVGSQSVQHSYNNSMNSSAHDEQGSRQDARLMRNARPDDAVQRVIANSAARGQNLAVQYRDESASHTRSPSNDTLLERDAFADELADRRRQVEEKLRNIAESRANFESQNGFGSLKKSASRSSLANEGGNTRGLKKFLPGSGSATPTGDDDRDIASPRRPQTSRKLSDLDQERTPSANGSYTPRSPVRTRDIGAERRARHAANMRSPTGTGPAAPRGQVEARKQQFGGATGRLPRDYTERAMSNPDQGKPHFHPAGRARHYSPPRANTTPDQKPHLPPQSAQESRSTQRSTSRSRFEIRNPNQPDLESPQMITRGTFPPPVGAPMQYASARKRSVSKADISSPVTLLSSTYAESTKDLSPGASLENGMDEVRAADASVNPPPVPPINPRRRAMGTFKKKNRSNTSSPDSEDEGSLSPRPGLRKQMSEGSNLRGRIRERIAIPASPSKHH